MATSVTSSFAGKATDFYLSALLEGKTLSTAGITIDNDVQYKYTVRGFDMTNIIQTGETCSFDDGGTTTVTEGTKEVQPFYINKTECIKDWKANWNGVQKDDLPAEVLSKLEEKIKSIIKAETDAALWKHKATGALTGSTGGTYTRGLFDGYVAQLNGTATELAGVTLTSANIVAQLDRVILAMPDAIRSIIFSEPSKGVIFVSHRAESLLKSALSSQGQRTSDESYKAFHQGIEVRGVSLFDSVMVAGLRESFHVASNVGMDEAKIDFINMAHVGEKNVRIVADYKYVPAVSNAAQIVLYGF
jgi:hypothetical protein